MKSPSGSPKARVAVVPGLLAILVSLILSILFVGACDGGDPKEAPTEIAPTTAVTVQAASDWDACQLDSTAKGSTDPNDPVLLALLDWCDTFQGIVQDGYVTTDNTGQAKMVNDSCTLYVYQGGDVNVLSDVSVEFCEEGEACVLGQTDDCSKLTVVSLLDTEVTFGGTTTIFVVDRKNSLVLVLVPDGTVNVEQRGQQTGFRIGAKQAGYVVGSDSKDMAAELFGFDAGKAVGFELTTRAIEEMGYTSKIQQANLTLLRLKLPLIPISVPYEMGFRWVNDAVENPSLLQGIAQGVEWKPLLGRYFPQGRLIARTAGQTINLSDAKYDSKAALESLTEGGISSDQEIILVYDESIPGLAEMADQIGQHLSEMGGPKLALEAITPESMHKLPSAYQQEKNPVLYLGGF